MHGPSRPKQQAPQACVLSQLFSEASICCNDWGAIPPLPLPHPRLLLMISMILRVFVLLIEMSFVSLMHCFYITYDLSYCITFNAAYSCLLVYRYFLLYYWRRCLFGVHAYTGCAIKTAPVCIHSIMLRHPHFYLSHVRSLPLICVSSLSKVIAISSCR